MTTSEAISNLYPKLLKASRSLTPNYKDLVQIVAIRLLELPATPGLIQRGELTAYALTILRNEVYNKYSEFNKLIVTNYNELTSEHEQIADEVWLGARLMNEQADVILNRLPSFEREFIQLWLLSGKSPKKLAEEIGIDAEYCRHNLYKSINKIKKYVRKRGYPRGADECV